MILSTIPNIIKNQKPLGLLFFITIISILKNSVKHYQVGIAKLRKPEFKAKKSGVYFNIVLPIWLIIMYKKHALSGRLPS